MRTPKDLKPITFPQLCAIVRTALLAEPMISDSEWKERTKERLARLEFDYPTAEMFDLALTRVEHALIETLGARPTFEPPAVPKPMKPQQHDAPWRQVMRSAQGWTSIADLIANLQGFVSSAQLSGALPEVTANETLNITEHQTLHEFWRYAGAEGADRVGLLRIFAEIAIVRPPTWDFKQIRIEAEATKHFIGADQCFGCFSGDREFHRHHIIQIQHGGSNTPRNRVALCDACHSDVHPWLPNHARTSSAWTSLNDIASELAGEEIRQAPQREGFVPDRVWLVASRTTFCGFDDTHVIAKGEWFLEMEVAPNVRRQRCAACAMTRHGAAVPLEEQEPTPGVKS